jgi:hypothetical protein
MSNSAPREIAAVLDLGAVPSQGLAIARDQICCID